MPTTSLATLAALPTSVWMRIYAVTTGTDLLASCRPRRPAETGAEGWWHAAAGSGDHPAEGGVDWRSRSVLGLVAAGDMSPISLSHGVQTRPSLWRLTCMLGPAVLPLVIVWAASDSDCFPRDPGSSRG